MEQSAVGNRTKVILQLNCTKLEEFYSALLETTSLIHDLCQLPAALRKCIKFSISKYTVCGILAEKKIHFYVYFVYFIV